MARLVLCILLWTMPEARAEHCTDKVITHKNCEHLGNSKLKCYADIPTELDIGTTDVVINCLGIRTPLGDVNILNGTFSGQGWKSVTSLEITYPVHLSSRSVSVRTGAFFGLDRLIYLRLHFSRSYIQSDMLHPLRNLEVLDLSNCYTVSQSDLNDIFFGPNVVPNLTTLILHNTGIQAEAFKLTRNFWTIISTRPITYLDIGGMQVEELSVPELLGGCNNLRYLNLSRTYISKVRYGSSMPNSYCSNMEILNATGTKWALKTGIHVLCDTTALFPRLTQNFKPMKIDAFYPFITVHTFIFNSLCEKKGNPVWFRSLSTVRIRTSYTDWNLKHFYVSGWDVQVLDITADCSPFLFETLWFTDMGLEFLRPPSVSCSSGVFELNLSMNKLETMRRNNGSVFEIIFHNFYQLQTLYLSHNGFTALPPHIFANNTFLKYLDLSGNAQTQVHFQLSCLEFLQTVDLSNNHVMIFDSKSISIINAYTIKYAYSQSDVSIMLRRNPIKCSKCEDKDSVAFLSSSNVFKDKNLSCLGSSRQENVRSDGLLDKLEYDCTITLRTTLGTTIPGILLIAIVIIICCIHRFMEFNRRIRTIKDQILTEGFIVFLSYAAGDDEFVTDKIFDQLDGHLQRLTGIERRLVSTGDTDFEFGEYIAEAMLRCLKKSAICIALVSESFCQSDFCRTEYMLAVDRKMPIMLMMKGNVSKDIMFPVMRDHFMKYTRIIWKENEGTFNLTSSWEHVCHSILKTIDFHADKPVKPSMIQRLRAWFQATNQLRK